MSALATSDDVIDRLGRALTEAEADRVDAVLIDASNTIRAYTGQQFTSEESTVTLRIKNRTVRFPQQAITAVATVADVNDNEVPFTWYTGDSFVTLPSSSYLNLFELNFPAGYTLDRAKVTYTHGYETVPEDIIGVVAQIAGRALGTPMDDTGVQSETIGSYSYSLGSQDAPAAAGPFGLLDGEKRILDRYRILAGAVPTI